MSYLVTQKWALTRAEFIGGTQAVFMGSPSFTVGGWIKVIRVTPAYGSNLAEVEPSMVHAQAVTMYQSTDATLWAEIPALGSETVEIKPALAVDVHKVGTHRLNHGHLDECDCGVTVFRGTDASPWAVVYEVSHE